MITYKSPITYKSLSTQEILKNFPFVFDGGKRTIIKTEEQFAPGHICGTFTKAYLLNTKTGLTDIAKFYLRNGEYNYYFILKS